MAKKKQYEDRYVEEMRVWLEQHRTRLKSCKESIASYKKQIGFERKCIKLEQAQMTIICQIIRNGEKELAEHLKKRKAKANA